MVDLNAPPFPSDPTARRAILVLGQHDYEKCEYDPAGSETLTDDEIFVLAYPARMEECTSVALRDILSRNIARPGEVLIQSPFDPDVYVPVAQAPEQFALQKHMNVSMLCQLLGAKSFQVEQIDLRTSSGKATLVIGASRAGNSFSGSMEKEQLETFKNQMSIEMVFAGGSPKIEAAEELLRKTGLWSDPKLRTLLEMRRDQSNALLSHKIILSLSNEAQSNLNIAARAKIPSFANISAEFKQVVKNRNEYTVTMDMKF